MDAQAPLFSPDGAPLEPGMLLHPGTTLLDLTGPELTAIALKMVGDTSEKAVGIAKTRREPA